MAELIPDHDRYCADHARIRAHVHAVEAECLERLSRFQSHGSDQRNDADLPGESRYLMPIQALPRLLQAAADQHTVAVNGDHRILTREDTYFDTPGWDVYLAHHRGIPLGSKCRYRRQPETGEANLAIKLNRKLYRAKVPIAAPGRVETEAIPEELPLEASLYVNYRRITLWNRVTHEQLSLDYDICFQRPGSEHKVRLPQTLVVELKRGDKLYTSPFVRQAKASGYLPESFRKYWIGVCLTDAGRLKNNRFKALLVKLRKTEILGESAP